jgi:hypothetical protein
VEAVAADKIIFALSTETGRIGNMVEAWDFFHRGQSVEGLR